MSNENIETTDEQTENAAGRASELAKNLWRASLGAYGKAYDDASDRYHQVSEGSPKYLDELIKKGSELEEKTKEKLATFPLTNSGQSIEERIAKMRESLGFSSPANNDDIERIEGKLDSLADSVSKLTKQFEGGGVTLI